MEKKTNTPDTPKNPETPITLPDVEAVNNLTTAQKAELIAYHREQLKLLRSVPRSDYHRGFEDALQLDVESWNIGAWTIREHTLGEDAPRIDFIVASGDKLPDDVKAVFKRFLHKNVIEFKGPGDKVTPLTIRKVAGYAYFYIATSKPNEGVKIGEVTATIFASEKDNKAFKEMEKAGQLEKTDVKGIYLVKGILDMPYQIVMTSEIEGREYAAYRVLKSKVDEKDVDYLLEELKKTTVQSMRDHLRGLLSIVEEKHTGMVLNKIEEDEKMRDVFWEYFKPQRNEEINNAVTTARADERRTNLYLYVQDGAMNIDYAAKQANMSPSDFSTAMTNAGYKLPQTASR